MSKNKMAIPTYRYHPEHAPAGKLFDAAVVDLDELAEKGWFDNPKFKTVQENKVTRPSVSEAFERRVAELDGREQLLDNREAELNDRAAELHDQLAILEADKQAFERLVKESQSEKIDEVVKTLRDRFEEAPKALTVQELYTLGKAIGAKVHHKHNEDTLINVISEHLNNGHSG
jgi:Skp family chaperone for outer membrane proteins